MWRGIWRRRVSREEGRDHDVEDAESQWYDGEKVGIQADEAVEGEEGERVGWCSPGEEPDETVLQDEENADAGVEAPEVVGHKRE